MKTLAVGLVIGLVIGALLGSSITNRKVTALAARAGRERTYSHAQIGIAMSYTASMVVDDKQLGMEMGACLRNRNAHTYFERAGERYLETSPTSGQEAIVVLRFCGQNYLQR